MKYTDYTTCQNLSDMMSPDTPDGWLYVGDEHTRYLLGEPKSENILIFGINPSTAKPLSPDPTIKKVKAICANQVGDYGWIMANLCPIRATKPEDLPKTYNKLLSANNIHILMHLLSTYSVEKIWAAWGDIIEIRDYLVEELLRISKALEENRKYNEILWYRTGALTKRGNPRHPLYLPKDSEYEPFYLLDYLCEFEGLIDNYGLL